MTQKTGYATTRFKPLNPLLYILSLSYPRHILSHPLTSSVTSSVPPACSPEICNQYSYRLNNCRQYNFYFLCLWRMTK